MSQSDASLRYSYTLLRQHWVLIFGCVGICIGVVAFVVFRQPNIYQSTATLMPLGASKSGFANIVGELGGFFPSVPGFSKESPTERLLAVLQSRTVSMDLVQSLDLLPRLFPERWDLTKQQWRTDRPPTLQDALRKLKSQSSITATKQGVITIAIEHRDATLAATIANHYLSTLQQTLDRNAFSLAKKNRVFIETQLAQTRQDLTTAEEELQRFEQEYKIVALDAQTKAAVETIAGIEGQIMFKEVQLGVQQRLKTGANQEVYLLQEELRGLRGQLSRLQNGTANPYIPSNAKERDSQVWPSFNETPGIKLRYARLQRETLLQNKLFTLLAQQLEHAKIEEARDEIAFQIVDLAIPTERPIKPQRVMYVLTAALFGLLLGGAGALLRASLDPTVRTRHQIEQHLGLKVLAELRLRLPSRRQTRAGDSEDERGALPLIEAPVEDALCYVHAQLRPVQGTQRAHTVLFTAVGCQAHTPVLLAYLATAAARAGERILLVDGNIYQPTLHTLWRCPSPRGLVDILTQPDQWSTAIHHTAEQNLHVLPAGAVNALRSSAIPLGAWETVFTHLKATYDYILYLAPPISERSDTAVLSRMVDATCLILTSGQSSFEAVRDAKRALDALQSHLSGAILVAT